MVLDVYFTATPLEPHTANNIELKHACFLDADDNRKKTFRVPGPYYLPDFHATHL